MKNKTLSLFIAFMLSLAAGNSYAIFPVKINTEHTTVVASKTNEAGHSIKKQAFKVRAKQYVSEHLARLTHWDDTPHTQNNKPGWPGVLSFVFGVLGFVCLGTIVLSVLIIPFSIAALVLGIVGLNKRYKNQGFAVAGLVLGAVGIALIAIIIALIAALSPL